MYKIDKREIHKNICLGLNEMYIKKNADYGDSVGELYDKLGDISLLTRISDKHNRLMSLLDPKNEGKEINYESINDTIMDMANYCIIWLLEREIRGIVAPIPPTEDGNEPEHFRGMDNDGDVDEKHEKIKADHLDAWRYAYIAADLCDTESRLKTKEEVKLEELSEKLEKFISNTNENFKVIDENFQGIYKEMDIYDTIVDALRRK